MDVAAARQEERPRRRWSGLLEEHRVLAVLLIAPAVIYVLVIVGVPFGWAIYLSFTDAIGGSLTGDWVGFDNFRDVWSDPNFRTALENTLVVTFATQVIVVVAAAVVETLWSLDLHFPQIDEAKRKELAAARKMLMAAK